MKTRTASIKETGEELSQADWARFDAAVAEAKAKRPVSEQDLEHPAEPGRQETKDATNEA